MKRAALVTVVLLLAAAGLADAHPLGNFSVNHLVVVRVSADGVDARYILDQAEIPTFQERGLTPAQVVGGKRAAVGRHVALEVDGRRVPLVLAPGGRISFPMGQGGLRTTRVELTLRARVRAARDVVVRDGTFAGRVGWKAVVVQPGRGTGVRSDVTSADPTDRLRRYPTAVLSSPADRPVANLRVTPGAGTVVAPRADGGVATTGRHASGDAFASVFERAANGQGVLLLLLVSAFAWGAMHALSPGHGKAMVAGYLVGTRGTSRDAVALGATVTVTHTAGVFALGLVALALSQYVLPEDLYPWLNLASGLLVLGVGAAVLRGRLRRAERDEGAHAHPHDHHHTHRHGHHHDHPGDHDHEPPALRPRTLVALGVSAGLIPCPSALVVLLGAVAQHQIPLGLLLICAFSAGLATTLTVLGLAVVHAGRLTTRLRPGGRVLAALPAVSSVAIVAVGLVLTARALPAVV
jgi:ABC-type nickel/cobalt efflux system permease component RcnA